MVNIQKVKKILLSASLTISMVVLTGCKDVEIFRSNEKVPDCPPVDAKDMEQDTFYVKDGTKFYKVLEPNGSARNAADTIDGARVMAISPDLRESFPVHYKDEIIAFTTKDLNGLSEVKLERMKDLGYSFGGYNGKWDSEGSLEFDAMSNIANGTSFAEAISDYESNNIKIVSINGEKLTPDNIDSQSGVIIGLNKDEDYTVALYAGTYYHEVTIKADCQMIAGYEMFNYGTEYMSPTQNGYMEFNTPTDLKSGYYIVNGQGMFKYLSVHKDEEEPYNMNEPYYVSEKDRLAAYSRQYSISVPNATTNMAISVEYGDIVTEIAPQGLVFSPNGTRYEMTADTEKHRLSLNLDEAMAGTWVINITPSSTPIVNIDVADSSAIQELTTEDFVINLDEERNNVVIKCNYFLLNDEEADTQINGSVTSPDGETTMMISEVNEDRSLKQKFYDLAAYFPYAPPGEYHVTINHYPAVSEVSEPELLDNAKTETDVIQVEE